VSEFNVKITLIEPGGYATDWRGSSASLARPMPEYDPLRERMKAASASRHLGDPEATADAILKVVDSSQPPLRLFLGDVGLAVAKQTYATRLATWAEWASVSASAQGHAN